MKCCQTLCLIATSQHFLNPLFAESPRKERPGHFSRRLLQFGTQQWPCTGIMLSCWPWYSCVLLLALFGVPFYYAISLLANDYTLALRVRKCKPAVELTQPFSQGSRYVARWLTRAEANGHWM